MTPSLTESGSPKHPPSKNVAGVGNKETHESGAPESSKTSFDPTTKAEPTENANRSRAQLKSSPEPDDDPIYPLREGYTRKLIRMKYCPPDEFDENFDEKVWMKEAYGENVIVVDMRRVPQGWILVDGMFHQINQRHH